MKPFYVTTPIYYVNDLPHIGHIYSTVVTDTIARYHRLMGDPTRFLTGSDEHGQNIEKAAATQGIAPIELADRVVSRYHDLYRTFEISHDDFIGLGRQNPKNRQESFCMAVLALKLAEHANGVSQLHGEVSRRMWKNLWPELPEEQLPLMLPETVSWAFGK